MESRTANQLAQAREHFFQCRLVDSYHLFRRYFDRLPFAVDDGHAEYVGMFVRILFELGKTNELNFYVPALEKHYARTKDPKVAYALGVVFRSLPDPKVEAARELFETIIRDKKADADFRARARMMLAHYHDWKHNDLGACRQLIDDIEEPTDSNLRALWMIWRIKILKDEKRLESASALLADAEAEIRLEKDWYAYFCLRVIRASLLIEMHQMETAREVVREVRSMFDLRQFRSLKIQVEDLERRLRERMDLGRLTCLPRGDVVDYQYESQTLSLKAGAPAEKLLRALIRKDSLDKDAVMKVLYGRPYEGADDDRLIYYHIHSLRKRLRNLGLPEGGITYQGKSYRLVLEAEITGEAS